MADNKVSSTIANKNDNTVEYSEYIPQTILDRIPDLRASMTDATEIALALLGNVDAGKSTLTACLCDRILDDGHARERVAVHNHEVASGKTSSVSNQIIEYSNRHVDAFLDGKPAEESDARKIRATKDTRKIVGLHDLCGHEKYFGTTSHGVSSMYPDAGLLVINPGRGVLQMTKEHYTLAVSLNVPILIVITKSDISVKNSCIETEEQINRMCKKYRRTPKFLNSIDDYETYKQGETIFHRIRSKILGGNESQDYVDRSKAQRIKIQTLRNDRDPFLTKFKSEFRQHSIINEDNTVIINEDVVRNFKQEYNLNDQEYEQLSAFVNYNTTKMRIVNDIVSNLNSATSGEGGQSVGKQSIVPVIYMSNFNGWNLDTVRDAIMFLKPRDLWNKEANSIVKVLGNKIGRPDLGAVNIDGSVFYIDRAYTVTGAGLVISGINRGETVKVNDELLLGPINKTFAKIKVKTFHNDARQFVDNLDEHHRGCLNITTVGKNKLTKNDIKKGMVLLSSESMTAHVAYHFRAVITVLKNESKSTTLRVGACPLLDAGTIKQTARLITIFGQDEGSSKNEDTKQNAEKFAEIVEAGRDLSSKPRAERKKTQEIVKPGEIKEVLFKFTRKPEFIPEGEQFIFRSGTVHGIGVVVEPIDITTDTDAIPDPVKKKHRRMRASNRDPLSVANVIKVE